MVSVATKISMFTMFSAMSLTNAQDAGQTLSEYLTSLTKQIQGLNDVQVAHETRINAVDAQLTSIEGKQITNDIFYSNQ